MLIGIMSDTHGRYLAARAAMELFQERGVAHVIHCGDVGGVEVFDEMLALPLTFVWGNTDYPEPATLAYLEGVALSAPDQIPARLTLAGKSFVVFHGHEPGYGWAERSGGCDYMLHGHTHECRDERSGSMRIINPGALHRARVKTVALLDLREDALTFHEIGV